MKMIVSVSESPRRAASIGGTISPKRALCVHSPQQERGVIFATIALQNSILATPILKASLEQIIVVIQRSRITIIHSSFATAQYARERYINNLTTPSLSFASAIPGRRQHKTFRARILPPVGSSQRQYAWIVISNHRSFGGKPRRRCWLSIVATASALPRW